MTTLFDSLKLGDILLPNRIVMAPLTRARAGETRTPNELMREYYVQRATAGLILTEATAVTPMGVGYADTPGIWNDNQVAGWRDITKAVHQAGGRIVMQLWHVGRISDPQFLNGALPVAPSAIAPKGHVSLVRPKKGYVTPRALTLPEIKEAAEAFLQGAKNAQLAGFDGVEIHGANGYLPDQFLHDGSNLRTDEYGGSIENRARFLLEVTDAAVGVWGAGRVGVHLSPRGDSHDVSDANPKELYSYVARELGRRKIAFIFLREHVAGDSLLGEIKKIFRGPVIANEAFEQGSAAKIIARGEADAVSFGRNYIANPDLVRRLREGSELNPLNPATIYAKGATGYTDYPALS